MVRRHLLSGFISSSQRLRMIEAGDTVRVNAEMVTVLIVAGVLLLT
jgi:hypothetical protein